MEDQAGSAAAARGTPRLLAAGFVALFMAALEQTIIGPILGDVLADLGSGPLVPWIATGFLIASTVAAPIIGALADLRGRRQALLLANGLFVAGSVLCALAPSLAVLVAGRILQGAGAGGLMALPFVIITDRVPMARRPAFSAYISTVFAVAGLAGPLAGGLLAETLGWRAAFWINLPAGLAVAWAVMSATAPRAATRGRQIDWIGALLLLCATVPGVLALEGLGGGGVPVLPAFLLALAFAAGFGARMWRAGDPLIPMSVLTNRAVLLLSLSLAATQGANIGLAVYLPLYFQHVHGFTAAAAGSALLALIGGVMVATYATPRVLRRWPDYQPLMAGASGAGVILSALLALVLARAATPGPVIAAEFGLGLSIGTLYPMYNLVVPLAAGRAATGAAFGVLAFLRSLGGTLGVTLSGLVAVAAGLTGRTGTLPVWLLALVPVGMMAIGFLATLFLPRQRLEGFGG